MESEKQTWLKAAFVSGAAFGERRSSLLSNAIKSMLPRAHAAAAVAPKAVVAAPGPVVPLKAVEPALDPQDPIMQNRRALVGKAYSQHMQTNGRPPKYDDLTAEVSGTLRKVPICVLFG